MLPNCLFRKSNFTFLGVLSALFVIATLVLSFSQRKPYDELNRTEYNWERDVCDNRIIKYLSPFVAQVKLPGGIIRSSSCPWPKENTFLRIGISLLALISIIISLTYILCRKKSGAESIFVGLFFLTVFGFFACFIQDINSLKTGYSSCNSDFIVQNNQIIMNSDDGIYQCVLTPYIYTIVADFSSFICCIFMFIILNQYNKYQNNNMKHIKLGTNNKKQSLMLAGIQTSNKVTKSIAHDEDDAFNLDDSIIL